MEKRRELQRQAGTNAREDITKQLGCLGDYVLVCLEWKMAGETWEAPDKWRAGVGKQWLTGQIQPVPCFYIACELTMVLMFFKIKRIQKRIIRKIQKKNFFCDTIKSIGNSNFSSDKLSFIGIQPSSFMYILSMAVFTLKWQMAEMNICDRNHMAHRV